MSTIARIPGGLRKLAMVAARDYDEQTVELAALRHDAVATCDYLTPRLDFLHPIAIELGHPAEQIVAGCLYRVAQLRKRATS